MATTKTKKNTKEVTEVVAKKVASPVALRITEKSALASEKGAYTFNVPVGTNKSEISKMIKAQYKVTPVKVNITKIQPKTKMRRGKLGTKSGGTKAVVYLKKGQIIEFA